MNITNENKNSLEINIQSPSSPLVPLNVHNFVKDINVPIDTKIETTTTMNGGATQTTTGGIFSFFTSFFQRFYPQSHKKNDKDPYLNKVFSSGNANVIENETKIDMHSKENNTILQNKSMEEQSPPILEDSLREEEADMDMDYQEITKIILTTDYPDIVLNDSLKGTKLFYFTQRTDTPSQWV